MANTKDTRKAVAEATSAGEAHLVAVQPVGLPGGTRVEIGGAFTAPAEVAERLLRKGYAKRGDPKPATATLGENGPERVIPVKTSTGTDNNQEGEG